MKHRVFISYHHYNDQEFKDELIEMADKNGIFIDYSVHIGDISDDLTDEQIREIIRDDYLKDSSVTIVLVGAETKNRKHVDWEIYSSMHDGKINKKSGIIVINLPSTHCADFTAAHKGEKENVFPENSQWCSIDSRAEYERRYPLMPDRIIDNLINKDAKISIISWNQLTPQKLKFMIDKAYEDRINCEYDLSHPLKRKNA